jgi:conjugal transfer pilus assembly protein TraV
VKRFILVPALLALALPLAACVGGGNIKGDFQCAAPGGTCAPMSSIDASAISAIGGFRSVGQPGIESQRVPHGLAGPVLADGAAPARTSDRVLRVVFPAHIDADGIYREQSAAHAVVEASAWTAALAGETGRGTPAMRSAGIVPTSAPGPSAPTSMLATLDEVIAARAAQAPGGGKTSAAPFVANSSVAAPAVAPVSASVAGSLAEAASGLSAPRATSLDPRAPGSNFDMPDVVASVVEEPRQAPAAPSPSKVASVAAERASARSATTVSESAPYGTRPVRWKGKTYQLPYKTPQSSTRSSSASAEPSAMGPTTSSLNRASLAKVDQSVGTPAASTTPPPAASYAVTSDGSVAQARIRSMAEPVIQSAANSGREAARAAAPEGLALPLASLKDAPQ